MKLYCSKKTGSYHRLCQDQYRTLLREGWVYLAVADGNGDEAYTRASLGARIACSAALWAMTAGIAWEEIPGAVKDRFDRMVEKHLRRRPLEAWELKRLKSLPPAFAYGTTLLFSAFSPGGSCWLYQLGDGEIHALDSNGSFLPTLPDDPHCWENLTTSLVQRRETVLRRFRSCHLPQWAVVMLFTDGFSGGWKAAQALLEADSSQALSRVLEQGQTEDDQTFLMISNPKAVASQEFRQGLVQALEEHKEKLRLERKLRRLRQDCAELGSYLDLALDEAERRCKQGDPGARDYALSLQPHIRRYRAMEEEIIRLEALVPPCEKEKRLWYNGLKLKK